MSVCGQCGIENSAERQVCIRCGKSLKSAVDMPTQFLDPNEVVAEPRTSRLAHLEPAPSTRAAGLTPPTTLHMEAGSAARPASIKPPRPNTTGMKTEPLRERPSTIPPHAAAAALRAERITPAPPPPPIRTAPMEVQGQEPPPPAQVRTSPLPVMPDPAPAQPALAPPPPPAPPEPVRTLLGPYPSDQNAPAPLPAQVEEPAPDLSRTLFGIGGTTPPAAAKTPDRDREPPHPPIPLGNRTMVGLAPGALDQLSTSPITQALPGYARESTEKIPSVPHLEAAGLAGDLGALPPEFKTIMGVAQPGIAPLNPGQVKLGAISAPPLPPLPLDLQVTEPSPETERRASPRWMSWAVISIAVVLLGGAALGLIFWSSRGLLEASLVNNAQGEEELLLSCTRCENGTVVRSGPAQAQFKNRSATIKLQTPLRVGDNHVSLQLERPGSRPEKVDVPVLVEFRVVGDTRGLEETPPKLKLLATALPGSHFNVAGKTLAFDENGQATYVIDDLPELRGGDVMPRTLEKRVQYTLTPPSGIVRRGEVNFRLGVPPLAVDAPGKRLVTEASTFVLAGRTAKGASVSVNGRPITVDPSGRFAQLMSVSATGETVATVRSALPGYAPRLFDVHLQRIESLAREAENRAKSVQSAYNQLLGASAGQQVGIEGTVVDAKTEGYTTLALIDVQQGCTNAPCYAKLFYGAESQLKAGSRVRVFGELQGLVEGPRMGTKIPEISADFLLKDRK